MKFVNSKEIAKKWKITERRVVNLCNADRIPGAYKNGMSWNIPEDVKKPTDNRTKYSKFETNEKTVVVAGINSEIGRELANILINEKFNVIGLYQKDSNVSDDLKDLNIKLIEIDYFDRCNLLNVTKSIKEDLAGFVFMEIYFNLEDTIGFDYDKFEESYRVNVFAMNLLTREFVKKMNYESSIVIVNSIEAFRGSFGASAYASAQAAKANLVQTFSNVFTEMYGVRINSIMAGWIGGVMDSDASFNKAKQIIPMKRLGHPEEIADDIFLMLTRHKYTTGSNLVSDGGYLSVDEQSKTEDLDSGKFYKILDKFFLETKNGSSMWIVSTMMENEWNEDPAERKFIQSNFDVVDRGVNMERIVLFNKEDADKFKTNPYLKGYMACNKMQTLFVDRKMLEEKNPKLLDNIADGWIGIDDYALLVDLPSDGTSRGYATLNKKEIEKAKRSFDELKKYAVPLKTILK